MFTSYAQNFEDVRLWRALHHVHAGRYIDIGAQDPIVDSVSRGFYERGWRGLHVEPSPGYAAKLRADRPDETVIQAAAAARPGFLTLFEFPNTGLSTADPEVARRHVEAQRSMAKIVVPSTTLALLFEAAAAPEIHWLKIDVEGFEGDVLRGWVGSRVRPWVVVVESTLPLTQIESYTAWERFLLRRGYQFACFDGLNRFYVAHAHRDLVHALSTAPNVFDGFSLSGTSTATFTAISVSAIQGLKEKLSVIEAARQADAAESAKEREARELALSDERSIATSVIEKSRQELDSLREQLLSLSQTLATREQAFGDRLAAVQHENASRVDHLMQRLQDIRAEHEARHKLDAEIHSGLNKKLAHSREEAVRLWNNLRRKSEFARDILRIQHEMAAALVERDRRITTLHEINVRQRSYLKAVFSSRSWRITGTMRELVQLVRGFLGKPVVPSLEATWAVDQAGFDALEKGVQTTPSSRPTTALATAFMTQELALRAGLVAQGLTDAEVNAGNYFPDVPGAS